MDSDRPRRKRRVTGTRSRQRADHRSRSGERRAASVDTSVSRTPRVGPAPPRHPMLGKRRRDGSCDTSRGRTETIVTRPFHIASSTTNDICSRCADIPWHTIDLWMHDKIRIDWRGRVIDLVGDYYRNVPPHRKCPVCRLLHAPWIEGFLEDENHKQRKRDNGDRLHIFPRLRHLPHVNDFQQSRNALRKHNALWHIAVVPNRRGYRDAFQAHVALRGLVIVVPKDHPEPELFVPQQIASKFNPKVVTPWLETCKRHRNRCNPRAPDVSRINMAVIDCESDDLDIVDYEPNCHYVALSYVWGKPASTEALPTAQPKTNEPQKGGTSQSKKTTPKPVAGNSQRTPTSKTENSQKDVIKKRASVAAAARNARDLRQGIAAVGELRSSLVIRNAPVAVPPATKEVRRLPKDAPLTIQDAVQVTKDLGFRYLWVDKYCIDQDDEDDKQKQCGRMGEIYAGAQITIFALGSDSKYGLPGVSSTPRLLQPKIIKVGDYTIVSTMTDPHQSIQDSVWSTRGWTYQEGLFSTRRLFFTDSQVYFECNAMNEAESFKSNLRHLHTRNGQRFYAFHRVGKFVSGNTTPFSHLDIRKNTASHRKLQTTRRYQQQIREYTRRELTHEDDILNAFAGVARFYAGTSAKTASLAGIPIPYPFADLWDVERQHRDYLSYALAWTHSGKRSELTKRQYACMTDNIPQPKRRKGFPFWSWAGWIGEINERMDLPYCWTSHLDSIEIGFRDGDKKDFSWLSSVSLHKQYVVRPLLNATALHFDAYVLNPEKLDFWEMDPYHPTEPVVSPSVYVNLSIGTCSLETLSHRIRYKEYECVVIGTYGEPRPGVMRAIRRGDKRRLGSRKTKIDEYPLPKIDELVCLIIYTVKATGMSYRIGLLRIDIERSVDDDVLQEWVAGPKRRFIFK